MEKETYLTFQLGHDLFAVNVAHVLEVLEKQTITQVPHSPEHILGIVNFRGEILPVVDSHKKFHLKDCENVTNYYLVIFDLLQDESHYLIAATADAVKDVIDVEQDEIKPLPEIGINYNERFIKGSIRRDQNFILILDTERVFSITDTEITNN